MLKTGIYLYVKTSSDTQSFLVLKFRHWKVLTDEEHNFVQLFRIFNVFMCIKISIYQKIDFNI